LRSLFFHRPLAKKTRLVFYILLILYLWLVSRIPVHVGADSGHDEALYVKLAESILAGNWLGKYDSFTLLKGPFYSVWIAFCFVTGIPLFFAQGLLYGLSGMLLIGSYLNEKNKYWLSFIYALYLFNPMFYAPGNLRVVRDNFYCSLTILLLAILLWTFRQRSTYLSVRLLWMSFLGFVLGAFWMTRDEGIWILPVIGFSFLCLVGLQITTSSPSMRWQTLGRELGLIFVSISVFLGSVGIVSFLNYRYYNYFGIIEFRQTEFLSAFGGLARIKRDKWIPHVAIPRKSFQLAYSISPTLSIIQKELEKPNGIGDAWASSDCVDYNINPCDGEMRPKVVFAIRDAMAIVGIYEIADKSRYFLKSVGWEINSACEKGLLSCETLRMAMTPPFRYEFVVPILNRFLDGVIFSTSFVLPSFELPLTTGSPHNVLRFQDVVKTEFAPREGEWMNHPITTIRTLQVFTFFGLLRKFYAMIMPALSGISFFLFLFLGGFTLYYSLYRKKREGELNRNILARLVLDFENQLMLFFSTLLLMTFCLRLFLLSYLKVVAMPDPFNSLYMSSIYPLIILFCGTVLAIGLNFRNTNK